MSKKRVASLSSASLRLFGPPPLLEGEDAAAYEELAARLFSAVQPTDFIEEFWARDLTDASWNILRLRRVQSAFLTAQVSDAASDAADGEATALAKAEAELMKGSEKEEMDRFLDDD